MQLNESKKVVQKESLEFSKERIITLNYSEETLQKLKAAGISYKLIEIEEIKDVSSEIPEEGIPIIALEKDLYFKLDQISQITTIPLEKIINTEINQILRDYVRENLFNFLDDYLGIENIESPIEIAKKLKDILDLSEDDILALENVDPVEYVNRFKKLNF